ncbi:helix-turn-helix domain-containing protein [Providencia sp.]|uniref:helix-turn-helix domain-containing protein n=1 Tax=Providencia TaxID=586 RepID=UPI0025A87AE7|nr:helix-turn-helix transcriptional regulator [Providencia rettgeri]
MLRNNKNLGLHLKKTSTLKHISANEMAELLYIPTEYYLSYENGEKTIYTDHLFHISKILNVDIRQLINTYLE